MPPHTKLQRWTDLIAALLARAYPVPFDDLARHVPAYAAALESTSKESVKRTFERDKDELREFGVPIESIPIDDGENTGYRLRATRFYLPFLTLDDGERRQPQPRPEGYRALPEVRFTLDQLQLLGAALGRLEKLGDPRLAADAWTAAGKLFFDTPVMPTGDTVDVTIVGVDRTPAQTFDVLTEALKRRKTVTFTYHAPTSDAVTERRADPWGLFFTNNHWYLAAFDRARDGLRNFRLSRMTHVAVNRTEPGTPDFTVPETFTLQHHAQSRAAWDLGDGEPLEAEVRFIGTSGVVRAAARNGEEVAGRTDVRRYPIRRLDVFARWLLSFAGDAEPLSPPALVETYRQLARDTLAAYSR